jgi:hypothetical protein
MCFYDLLAQAVQDGLPTELLLKFIAHTKIISNEYIKKEGEYKQIIKEQIRTSYKLACIGQPVTDIIEETDENNQINVSVISDTAEYTLKELAETLQISYKTCAKRFKEMKVPRERREAKGSIYLGKTVKKSFQNQGN